MSVMILLPIVPTAQLPSPPPPRTPTTTAKTTVRNDKCPIRITFRFKLCRAQINHMSTEAIDTIFIGKKPLMAYVTSTLIQLANLPTVHIKARGMSIGRAVDVAQIISRKTEGAGYAIGDIRIGSESMESKDGKPRNVSTIEKTSMVS